MEKNLIFCFTGTGNSLKVAKDIAESLPNCTILLICDSNIHVDLSFTSVVPPNVSNGQSDRYTRIGFIFPVYFLGIPLQVSQFINQLAIPKDFTCYFFTIVTYANYYGNGIRQIHSLLQKRGHRLDYGNSMKMGDNAIAYYKSNPNFEKLEHIYNKSLPNIISAIIDMDRKKIKEPFIPIQLYHNWQISHISCRDQGFEISTACTRCGLCVDVCPANNITLNDIKPSFRHHCQQCMSCIQLCPKKAIDYKNRCGKRPRYKNPDISTREIKEFNSITKS